MRKILSPLGAIMMISSTALNLMSCNKPEKDIHAVIREVLSEPIEYYGDWVIDYSKFSLDEVLTGGHGRERVTRFLEMLINKEIIGSLRSRISNFDVKYPDFTSHVIISYQDPNIHSSDENSILADAKYYKDLKKNLFSNGLYKPVFKYYYNLNQLQNIDVRQAFLSSGRVGPNDLLRGSLGSHGKYYGEYNVTYKKSLNQFKFKQSKFIIDDTARLNYLQKLIDNSPNTKALDVYFNKIVKVGNSSWRRLYISEKYFPNKDILEKIIHGEHLNIYSLLKQGLKEDLLSTSTLISDVINYMPEMFDDIDIDFEIIKIYSRSDVLDDSKLKALLGNLDGDKYAYFQNHAILFKFKVWLLKNNVRSTNYIEDYFMGEIFYTY